MAELQNCKMLYVGGSTRSFRYQCGCNVFHHPPDEPEIYECSGCETRYAGEKEATVSAGAAA